MMRVKFLCLIIGHAWHYRLSEVGYVPLHGWPTGTRCERCGAAHPNPLPVPTIEEVGE